MIEIRVHRLRISNRILAQSMVVPLELGTVNLLKGPNGCGKSLLLDCLFDNSTAGSLELNVNGYEAINAPLYRKWKMGFRRLYQFPILPGELLLSDLLHKYFSGPDSRVIEYYNAILALADIKSNTTVGTLSYGQKRTVELLICLSSGRYFFLDEPFAGLNIIITKKFKEFITDKVLQGNTFLIIDHLATKDERFYNAVMAWQDRNNTEVAEKPVLPVIAKNEKEQHREYFWTIKRFSIESRNIIEHKEIRLQNGSWLVIRGKNGSGKSTLLRALGKFSQPGYRISSEIETNVNREECILSPQPPKLIEGITVFDNIKLCMGRGRFVGKNRIKFKLYEHFRYFGLDNSLLKYKAESLSAGEASIVAVIASCLSNAQLIFLDEPFENLDGNFLRKTVEYLRLFPGKTFLITDHSSLIINPHSTINLSV